MGFSDFLLHRCNVYHIISEGASPGYGLPASLEHSYPDTPDIENVACHFHARSGSASVVQREPQTVYDARIKLSLPWGTDIRVNDKIVDLDTGLEFTAEMPRKVRRHHVHVMVTRRANQEAI